MFMKWSGSCKFIWNWALNQRIEQWERIKEIPKEEREKSIGKAEQSRELTQMKKSEELEWLKETNSTSFTYVLEDLDAAFKSFFRRPEVGFPKFKGRRWKRSFTIQNTSIKVENTRKWKIKKTSKNVHFVTIPKMDNLKIKLHRPILGTIKSATITLEVDGWYISFTTQREVPTVVNNGLEPVGVDRGVVVHSYCSDGTIYELPDEIKKLEQRIAFLQKKYSRMKKGSQNWKKAQAKIRKKQTKIARIRSNFNHNVSRELVDNHGMVAIENLKVKNMTKSAKGTAEKHGKNVAQKSGLNRSNLRQGWYQLEVMLGYKAEWYGSELRKVPAHYTSQKCSKCGHTEKANRTKQDEFKCQQCGHEQNADYNASINILNAALLGK